MSIDAPGTLTGADHPETSFAAAARVLGKSGSGRRRVMELLASYDLTDEEMASMLHMSPNTQRPRRVELVDNGYVVATGERRQTISGARSIVWTATDAGRVALALVRDAA